MRGYRHDPQPSICRHADHSGDDWDRLSPTDRPPSTVSRPVTAEQHRAGAAYQTYALLPGHWQLQGSQYLWVPPEMIPRPVTHWRFVEGLYVWRGSEWIWVPAHYE